MSAGEWIIIGGLAFLLVVGTKGKATDKAPDAKKQAPPPPRPNAMRWMSRGS
ncbi:hypothetical protein [Sediminicoccus sp. BL-A-41-H5]|uniref:hypothetical protein n=1 Tax=Sediminicoccus sp. BL-A-41-H5 TaxID=3421106 RepID=UPI003D67FDBB